MLASKQNVLQYDVRIIVAGSRNFNDWNRFEKVMLKVLEKFHHERLLFISGDAVSGPDRMIIEYCEKFGLDYVKVPADWDNINATVVKIKFNSRGEKYNALAGFARNEEMAQIATHLIAFWDNQSPGTQDMMERASAHGLKAVCLNF